MNINIIQHLSPGWVWPQPIATTTSNNRNLNVRAIWVWVCRLNDFVRLFRWRNNIRLTWLYLDVYTSRGSLQLVVSNPFFVATDWYFICKWQHLTISEGPKHFKASFFDLLRGARTYISSPTCNSSSTTFLS